MITIIHGEDIAASRNFLQEEKKKHKDLVLFEGGKLTITDLVQNIEGTGLFGDTKTIFIEDFFGKIKKSSKEAKEIIEFLNKNSKTANIVFWESKEIQKRDLSSFKSAVVKTFKLPQTLFVFLDSLKPNNSKSLITLFHNSLENGIKEELILFMLQRQFRLLLSLSHNDNGKIDEVVRLAPWQKGKLEKQAKLFSEENLKQIYKKLFEIELGQKTGTLNLSLVQAIDFLLLEI